MGQDLRNPSAPPRTSLLAPGDWELQVLQTPLWLPDESTPLRAATSVLLCPGSEEMPDATDHLQHEFHDTTWTCHRLAPGPGRMEQLVRALPCPPWQVSLLIHVGRVSPEDADEIEGAVRRLRQENPAYGVIVCCDHADIRPRIRSAHGYVRHGLRTRCREALQLAAMLHGTLAAPHTVTCVDLEDIKLTLGSASEPALFGEAIRLHGTGRYECVPPIAPALRGKAAAAFALFAACATDRMPAVEDAFRYVRELARPDAHMVAAASVAFERSVPMQGSVDRVRFWLAPSDAGADEG